MNFTAPNLVYASGVWDSATPCSLPVLNAPFTGVNIDYVLTQDFMINVNQYVPLALNTPYSFDATLAAFLLVSESPRTDLHGGMQRWTRTYAIVPATYNQPSSVIYNFIGYLTTDSPAIIGRSRINLSASARVQYDYFLLDAVTGQIFDSGGNVVWPVAPAVPTPGTLPSLSDVPVIQVQKYFDSGIGSVKLGIDSDSISYGIDAGADEQTVFPVPDTTSNQPPYWAYPTRDIYESWRDRTATVKRYNSITNTTEDTGQYDIVAIGSQNNRWLGNIIERQTIFVKPQ